MSATAVALLARRGVEDTLCNITYRIYALQSKQYARQHAWPICER